MDRRSFLKAAGAAGAAGLTAGCLGQFGDQPYSDGDVRFLMSPTEPQDQMTAQYTPVQERLAGTIDEVDEVDIKYAANYAATLNALDSGTADVAETGPFAAALGVNSDKAEIILQRQAFGAWTYKSVIVTKEGSDIESLSDLEGRSIALADALSASGSLYPLSMLKNAGLEIPDEPGSPAGANFDPSWSGHASAMEALRNDQAAAAGVGYFIAAGDESEYAEGIREVASEDGIPRAPIVVSPDLSDDEKDTIIEAFTDADDSMYYGEDGEKGTDDDLWFNGVRERGVDTYQPVIDAATGLGYSTDVFKDDEE